MLNYYPRDINFGSLTQTIINVETNSFQPAQKMHMGQACCVGIVWICNECFVMFSLQLFILVSFSSFSLKGEFLFELRVHYLVIDRGSIVNLFCSLLTLFSNFCLPSNTFCLIIPRNWLLDRKQENGKGGKTSFQFLVSSCWFYDKTLLKINQVYDSFVGILKMSRQFLSLLFFMSTTLKRAIKLYLCVISGYLTHSYTINYFYWETSLR